MKDKSANASPLGSLGFGMTTILYSIVSAGFFDVNAMLLSMAIFLGGSAQLLAGILEYKKGNTFGFTSYTMFGLYWYTSVSLTLMPILKLSTIADSKFMGFFFLLRTIFTLILFLKALKMDRLTKIIFATVVVLFTSITLSQFTQLVILLRISGYVGILCGLLAIFSAYKNFDA